MLSFFCCIGLVFLICHSSIVYRLEQKKPTMTTEDRTHTASTANSGHQQTQHDNYPGPEETQKDGDASLQSDSQPKDTIKAGPPAPSGQAGWGKNAPDGGLEAWLVIVGNWCASFCSFGWINSMWQSYPQGVYISFSLKYGPGIGTFQNYYSSQLLQGYSEGDISWIPSLQIFFMMAMVRQLLR